MRISALTGIVASMFVVALLAVPGCGDDEKPKEKKQGTSIECGPLVCDSVVLPRGYDPIEACCAANGECGLDGKQFEQYGANFGDDSCQPHNQPGEQDSECPDTEPIPTDFGSLLFRGCCTPAGRCGYLVNRAIFFDLDLGCIDGAPFLDGGVPASCTPGAGGAGSQ